MSPALSCFWMCDIISKGIYSERTFSEVWHSKEWEWVKVKGGSRGQNYEGHYIRCFIIDMLQHLTKYSDITGRMLKRMFIPGVEPFVCFPRKQKSSHLLLISCCDRILVFIYSFRHVSSRNHNVAIWELCHDKNIRRHNKL